MNSDIGHTKGRKIFRSVSGAPFDIGDDVIVVYGTDETFLPKYLGKTGTVVYFDYSCGCGQTYPKDPMIGVRFPDGTIEEFWREEISLRSRRKTLNRRR